MFKPRVGVREGVGIEVRRGRDAGSGGVALEWYGGQVRWWCEVSNIVSTFLYIMY